MTDIRRAELANGSLLRVLSEDGSTILGKAPKHMATPSECLDIFRAMMCTRAMDDRMLKLQRQGRVAFVGTSTGQEAAIHASAAAFTPRDFVFSALREGGVAIQRGMPMREYVAHMFGNAEDTAKGRQMPNHFQCKDVNFPSWSSVLGTQLPHAVGTALAAKARGQDHVVCAYSGDGATSSSGFHSAMNFAGVTKVPVVFVVVDNGWAISVPSARQTGSSSYGAKADAYGMPGINVDGNDPLAVFAATKAAVERARNGEGPSLVALRTYRLMGHSSSDDPSKYRNQEEVDYWNDRDPLDRFENWLVRTGALKSDARESLRQELDQQIAEAVTAAEAIAPPELESLVEDVYAEPPRYLRRQVIDALRLVAEKGAAEHVEGKFPL